MDISFLVKAIRQTDWGEVWKKWEPETESLASIWTFNRKRLSYCYWKLYQIGNPEEFPIDYLELRGKAIIRVINQVAGWLIYLVAFHGWIDVFVFRNGGSLTQESYDSLNQAIRNEYTSLLALDHFDVMNVIAGEEAGELPLKWKKEKFDLFYGKRYRLIFFDVFDDEEEETYPPIGDGFNLISGATEQKEGRGQVPHMVNLVFHPTQASYWATLDMPLPLDTYSGNDPHRFEENFIRFLWLS